jgi:hypothetical protein
MLLLLSTSLDGTADVLRARSEARGLPVFRVNTDLLGQHGVEVGPGGFVLSDPTGRRVALDQVTAALWRKPWLAGEDPAEAFPGPERPWVREQQRALVRELAALCRLRGVLRLVEPGADRRLGKLAQLTLARRHLEVPDWAYTLGAAPPAGARVAKALVAEQLHLPRLRFLYTTIVEGERLDPRYPWLTQAVARGTHDATVVHLRGELHAFRVARARADGPTDWRERINTAEGDAWAPLPLPGPVAEGIRAFMREAGLHYGRLDFIVDGDGRFEFLEVNSNGQFGWLDDPSTWWLHDRVLDAVLDPATAVR